MFPLPEQLHKTCVKHLSIFYSVGGVNASVGVLFCAIDFVVVVRCDVGRVKVWLSLILFLQSTSKNPV